MKAMLSALLRAIFLLTLFSISAHAQVLIHSEYSLHDSYTQSMNKAFGEGNWSRRYYETVNVDSLLTSGVTNIYMEGSGSHVYELNDFLSAHRAKLENWVLKGGMLYINTYLTSGNELLLGFGHTEIIYSPSLDSIVPADPAHEIFNGASSPTGNLWWGYNSSYSASSVVKGTGIRSLLIQKGDSSMVVLAEKNWGGGKVLVGTLNSWRYIVPQPESFNLQSNILRLRNTPKPINAVLENAEADIRTCPGQLPITVSLTNYGTAALSSAVINWEIDGVSQTPFLWSDGLPPYSGEELNSQEIILGTLSVETTKSYAIKAWLSQLNGEAVTVVADTVQQSIRASLNGVYTIGADSSDFSTIQEAVDLLQNAGVCGPVVFNIKPGYYTKGIFKEIPGASAVNTVTFQSLSGNNDDVIIQGSLYYFDENYILHFNGTGHLTFRNLTIQAGWGSSEYGNVLVFEQGAHHLSFINNRIIGRYYQGSSSYASVINLRDNYTTKPFSDILFKNNTITQGSYGIYAVLSNNSMNGLRIEGNSFSGQYTGAMYLLNHAEPKIESNSITGGNSSDYQAIYLTTVNRFSVLNNEIRMNQGGQGILMASCVTAGTPSLVANNAIIAGGATNNVAGIYLSSCDGVNIYHNTVNMTNGNSLSAAIRLSLENKNLRIFNNNFCVRGIGFAGDLNYAALSDFFSDHNNFYSAGAAAIRANNSLMDLKRWNLLALKDSNSVSVDAAFLTEDGYKVSKGMLDGKGIPLTEVTTDMEQDPRDALRPDIGADEFTSAGADIKMMALEIPAAPFAPGQHPVRIKVMNSGAEEINSFTIQWAVNGSDQTSYGWTGALAKGDTTSLLLGQVNFAFPTAYDISAEIPAPNGVQDVDTSDNTISRNQIYAAVPAGNYTVGGLSPDFPSFEAVQNVLNKGGVGGNVSFLVRDGLYNEQFTLASIPGSAFDRKIEVRSESGDSSKVTLTYITESGNGNYVVKLQNASYITFREMTFKVEGSSYGYGIFLDNTNSHIQFLNNRISGEENPSYSSHSLVYQMGSSNEAIVFENNFLEYGRYGFQLNNASGSLPGTTLIRGNILKDQYSYGISLSNQSQVQVIGNTISNTLANTSFKGINLSHCKEGIQILKNSIESIGGMGLNLYYVVASPEARLMVANNFIKVGGTSTAYALYIDDLKEADFYYNTFHAASTSTSQEAVYIEGSNAGIRMFNNHFVNTGGGYALYFNSSSGYQQVVSDYNNFFSTGAYPIYSYSSSKSQYATVKEWNTYSAHDAHSFELDPKFGAAFPYAASNPKLNGTALPVVSVAEDMLNQVRSNAPDIGPVEFTPEGTNAALDHFVLSNERFEAGTRPLGIVVRNNGGLPITGLTVSWKVNETVQSNFLWTGLLAPNDSDTINIGSFNFLVGQLYRFEVMLSGINGAQDIDSTDNKIVIDRLGASLNGTYTIGGAAPDFENFNSAANALRFSGVSGKVIFNIRPGTYTEQVTLKEIPGAGPEYPVIFQSENGDSSSVILTYYASNFNFNYTLRLDSTDYVTIKGITVQAENSSYSGVISLVNGTKFNTFSNNRIIAHVQSSTNTIYIYPGKGNSHNRFEQNYIVNGYRGFGLTSYETAANKDEGNWLLNNSFTGQREYAIDLYGQVNARIEGNRIDMADNMAISIGSSTQFRISDNRISLATGGTGISIYGQTSTDTSRSGIFNNFIHIKGSKDGQGISLSNCSMYDLYFNTVWLNSESMSAFAVSLDQCIDTRLYNNLLVNAGKGNLLTINKGSGLQADHNNYFCQEGSPVISNSINYSLANWQNQSSQDAHTISINPVFKGVDDLHTSDPRLNNKGIQIAGIDEDIDGDIRETMPDIGADENAFSGFDLGLLAIKSPVAPVIQGLHEVKVTLYNNSSAPVSSAELLWAVNDTVKIPVTWTGLLAPAETADVSLGYFNLTPGKNSSLKIWLSNSVDTNPLNDTIVQKNLTAGMKGVYTIGKDTSSHFASFKTAVTALTNAGVAGHVEFHVKNGTYNEQVTIPRIFGASDTSTITFKPMSGIAGDVTLTFSSTNASNYLMQLNSASYIHIKGIRFVPVNSSYGICISVNNHSSNNSIEGNLFEGIINSSSSNTSVIRFNASSPFNYQNNRIENNFIKNGGYGIYMSGTLSCTGNSVEANVLEGQYYTGIYINTLHSTLIRGNKIISGSSYSSYTGMFLYYLEGPLQISRNKIDVINGAEGIDCGYYKGGGVENGIIDNNFITIRGTGNSSGVLLSNCEFIGLYYNSVLNKSTNLSSNAFRTFNGKSHSVMNNIFAHAGTGVAASIEDAPAARLIDRNNYYAAGGKLFSSNPTLIDWRVSRGVDLNSVSLDPIFESDTVLRPGEVALNRLGKPVSGITMDIDGELRHATRPAIGADEKISAGADAGIHKLISPATPFPSGQNEVSVLIRNYSELPLEAAALNWSLNGVNQPAVAWTGSLALGDTTLVKLGEVNFTPHASYSIKIWTSLTGGQLDVNAINDTIHSEPLYAALKGVYTIGGTNPDFGSIDAAVTALQRGGIIDSVTFNIRNGIYNEQVIIPKIKGAGNKNSIIFQSESSIASAVEIKGSGTSEKNYLIRLNGSDGVTFRNLTFSNTSITYGRNVSIGNNTENAAFINVSFNGPSVESTSNNMALVYIESGDYVNDQLLFAGNTFNKGAFGIYASGISESKTQKGLLINDNTFKDFYAGGIELRYHEAPVVSGNIFSTNSTSTNLKAVYVVFSTSNVRLVSNRIHLYYGGTGISLSSLTSSTAFSPLVVNNFIYVSGDKRTEGISTSSANNVNIYHNTVHVISKKVGSDAYALSIGGTGIRIFNNLLINSGIGYAVYFYNGSFTSNYNNLYTNGEFLGYYDNIQRKDLVAWRSATSRDVNTISRDPYFINPLDLRVTNGYLNDAVPQVAGVTTDIDGEVRKSLTDIGADEFTPPGTDAGLEAFNSPMVPMNMGMQNVNVKLYNSGAEPLNSVVIHWSVNGTLQPTFNWSGTLMSKGTSNVNLGDFEFLANQPYELKVWAALPNGSNDPVKQNDTITFKGLSTGLSGIYTIGGNDADFPNFTKASEALMRSGVTGPVEFRVNDGIYSEQIVIEGVRGISASNTITFISASKDSSKVTITYNVTSGQNYIVWLNGVDYITFEKITINIANTTSAQAVKLTNGADFINIRNCVVSGRPSASHQLIYSSGSNTNNKFSGNLLLDGSYALYLEGTSSLYQKNEVSGNVIHTQTRNGIYLSYQSGSVVNNNTISPVSNNNSYEAIYCVDSRNGLSVFNNTICLKDTESTGIYLDEVTGTSNFPVLIYNNFVSHTQAYGNRGIYIGYCQKVQFYHNNLSISGTGTNLMEVCNIVGGQDIDVRNNVLANFSGGKAIGVSSSAGISFSDYNDLYTTGVSLAHWGATSTLHATLENLQAATGKDQHSVSIDPLFTNSSDLHVDQVILDGTATPISLVKYDIDGQTRNDSLPDIGADEFGTGLITKDLGIVSIISPKNGCDLDGNQYLTVKVQNFGVDSLSNFYLNYVLNDTVIVKEQVTNVKLKGGQALNYTFKTPVKMNDHLLYTFDVFTSLEMDSNPENDSITGYTVHHYPVPTADAGKDTIICERSSTKLTGNGGTTYTWHLLGSETIIGNNRDLFISPSSKTIYVLKAYNTYGCFDQDTIVVDVRPVPETPVITREGELGACSSDTIRLISSVSKNIVWSTGETTPVIEVTKTATYKVTHKDSLSGCSSSAEVSIVRPNLPYVSQSSSRVCPGTSVTLSVLNGGSSFLWSTGAITSSITVTPSSTTTYSVSYHTEGGCSFDRSLTVSVYAVGKVPSITSISGDSAVCAGEAAVLTVNGTADRFTWSNGYSGQTITVKPKEKTLYTVTASGGMCMNKQVEASIEVDILPSPEKAPVIVATGSSSLTLCDADSIVLNSSDYSESIRWSTGDTTRSIKVLTQGIYSLSHMSEFGCIKTSSVKIENPPAPYIEGNTEICEGQSTTLSVKGGYKYKWSTGAITQSITVSPDTTTEYTVEIETIEGCKFEETVSVRLTQAPVITGISADTSICKGEEIELSVTGTAKEFLWTDGQSGSVIKVKPESTTQYGVRATNGCSSSTPGDFISVNVKVLPVPEKAQILQGALKTICPGEVLTLESSRLDSIRWSDGSTTSSIVVADTGLYKLFTVNEFSCTSYSQIKVAYAPAPAIMVEGKGYKTICRGDTAILTVINASTYQWSNGASARTIRVSPVNSTEYIVSGKNSFGCTYRDTITINVIQPSAPAEVKNLLPADNKIELSLPLSLSWSPSANASHYDLRIWKDSTLIPVNPTVSDLDQITYLVKANELDHGKRYNWQVTAKNSCSATSSAIQKMEIRSNPDFMVKNVILPTSAFSGQEVLVSFEVKNQGPGRTMDNKTWFDGIYLSADSLFQSDVDTYLKGAINVTALDTGQSYISSSLVRLPKGISGTYYIFVKADNFKGISETDKDNNITGSSRYMLIHLTPPPDLQVTEVQSLTNVFSGQSMDVSYTVTNKGKGLTETSRWRDLIYFSSDSVLRTSSATLLTTLEHTGYLEPGKFYATTTNVILPQGIFGPYFVHVVTDAADQVFEHAYNNNNAGRGSTVNVTLLPPSDIIPSAIVIPSKVSNNDRITVQWTVRNQGGTKTSASRWKDEIYIYNNLVFNAEKAVLAGSRTNYNALDLGESYTASVNVKVPENISGAYYVFIYTDRADEVFEYENKHNNLVRSTTILNVTSPDLVVEKVEAVSAEIRSGQPLSMRWVLKNTGTGVLQQGAVWADSIFVRRSLAPDTTKPVLRTSYEITTDRSLNPGDTISFTKDIVLPEGISGNWYLQVQTNADRRVFEVPGGSANNTFAKNINVTLSPWADLKITSLSSVMDTAEAGAFFPLQITVVNEGSVATKDKVSWIDKAFISSSQELTQDTVLVAGARADFILEKDSSYSYTLEVPVPASIEKGSYYLHVIADAGDKIFEHTGEGNNHSVYGPFYIKDAPATDLALTGLTAPDTVWTGMEYDLSWTVKNAGIRPAYTEWDDAVFLSKDTLWQPDKDIYLSSAGYTAGLDTGKSYTQSHRVKTAEGISGLYYWIAVTDYSVKGDLRVRTSDKNRTNNYTFVPVWILLNPAPDLMVNNVQSPELGVAGQPVSLSYTVTNQGPGTTRPGTWSDKIYLSTDFKIDEKNDILVSTIKRSDTLLAAETYSKTVEVLLPSRISGNYILLVKTDYDNMQYEGIHEDNNQGYVAIHIETPLPVDLHITDIRTDTASYLTGEMVKVQWTVVNEGVNPAVGFEEDHFYLSRDEQWDLEDILLGVNKTYLTLAPNSSKTYEKTMKLAAPVGNYYILVRTDSKDQIPETNERNNISSSVETIKADVRELVINVTEHSTLEHKGTIYYKVVVPDSLVGETLLVQLIGQDRYNHNELYIRHHDAPTRNIYDDAFDRPFSGNQEVIISDMKPGTYYVMAYGENEQGAAQSVSLTASIVHFGIRSVTTNVGGDTGPVTTCIEGAKFTRNTKFTLYKNNEGIVASRVLYVSPTKVYATFDLTGAARGYYDVVAEDSVISAEAMMLNGFSVEKGTNYLLETDLEHPSSTRAGRIVPVLIRYANGGNIDIPTPQRSVVYIRRKVPVALSVSELKYHFSSVNFEFSEPEGPVGILRPGAIGDITFYVWALDQIHLKIITR